MGNFIANEDCVISILPPVLTVEGVTVVQVMTPASEKVKVNGKGVYSGIMKVSVAGTKLASGHEQVSPAIAMINASIIKKNKADGKLMLAVGDQGLTDVEVSFSNGITTVASKIAVQITDAGQKKVMAV